MELNRISSVEAYCAKKWGKHFVKESKTHKFDLYHYNDEWYILSMEEL